MTYLFVGERPSELANQIGATWENGRLAARQLHDALRASGIDPLGQRYLNLWTTPGTGPISEPVAADVQALLTRATDEGYTIVGMGRLVSKTLEKMGIAHLLLVHPAARGSIRRKDRYAAHLASVLKC